MKSITIFLSAVVLCLTTTLVHAVSGTARVDNSLLNGMNNGKMKLYAPNPVQTGSSVSHWDRSATPNLLMEPSINADLPFQGLDITPEQMQDIGWTLGNLNIVLFDLNGPGDGFTDPTPFVPVGGNGAATLGQARVNLLNSTLSAWANTLDSVVPVDVLVIWIPLPCSPAGAALAAAGTTFIFFDDGSVLPLADTWYHASLAEAIFGGDLTGPPASGGGDIIVFINSEIDNECLGPGTGYYYGLDGNAGANDIDLGTVVLHELAHGLGFSNFTNETNGAFFLDMPGVFDHMTLDTTTGQTWNQMTAPERASSAVRDGRLVWNGAQVNGAAQALMSPGVPVLKVPAPPAVAGSYEISQAAWAPQLNTAGVSGTLNCLVDLEPDHFDACTPSIVMLNDDIALARRGSCAFVDKARNAQQAGAKALLIVNNVDSLFGIGASGDTSDINIPVLGMRSGDGDALIANACAAALTALPVPVVPGLGVFGMLLLVLGLMLLGMRMHRFN